MNYYSHHIGDFNNATRHLTRIERSLYRDMMELYYDSEKPLPLDLNLLCRKVVAHTDEEKQAVASLLPEFFTETPEGWRHDRCDEEIAAARVRMDEAEGRRENERERQRRARERRRALFDELRSYGEVPKYDTSTEALVTLLEQRKSQGDTPMSRVTGPLCHGPVTATQLPIPNNQLPDITTSGQNQPDAPIPPEKKERRQTRRFTPEDEKCARWLFGRNLAVNATAKAPNFATWSEDVRLMREIDGRTHAGICELYQWAKKDAFWSPNIQSPGKLREKWDQLTEQKMRPAKPNGAAPKDGRFFGLNEIDRSGDVQAAAANREKHGIVIDPDDDYDFNAPPAPPKESK